MTKLKIKPRDGRVRKERVERSKRKCRKWKKSEWMIESSGKRDSWALVLTVISHQTPPLRRQQKQHCQIICIGPFLFSPLWIQGIGCINWKHFHIVDPISYPIFSKSVFPSCSLPLHFPFPWWVSLPVDTSNNTASLLSFSLFFFLFYVFFLYYFPVNYCSFYFGNQLYIHNIFPIRLIRGSTSFWPSSFRHILLGCL